MKFDIERMMARAAECKNQSMYIECAITEVVANYYFGNFVGAIRKNGDKYGTVKMSGKQRAVEIDGCRIYFIRFDNVITKRMFDNGGVIWDYIVEEDE